MVIWPTVSLWKQQNDGMPDVEKHAESVDMLRSLLDVQQRVLGSMHVDTRLTTEFLTTLEPQIEFLRELGLVDADNDDDDRWTWEGQGGQGRRRRRPSSG